jgi:hypothetical protein
MREQYQSSIPGWYSYQERFNPVQVLDEGAAGSAAAFQSQLTQWVNDIDDTSGFDGFGSDDAALDFMGDD